MLTREEFIENILDHFDQPRNKRALANPHIEATGRNPGCGDVIVLFARLDEHGRIADVGFQGEGCTISQAAASMLTDDLVGRTLEAVTQMSFEDVIEEMGKEVVATRTRCATLALTTMKNAAAEYVVKQQEWG